MKEGIYHILKGKFLVNEDALKNWKFIIFLSVLALIMIASSHSADKKVHRIAALSNEVKELKSQNIDVRMKLMETKMESRVIKALAPRGIEPSTTPPMKIMIQVNKNGR